MFKNKEEEDGFKKLIDAVLLTDFAEIEAHSVDERTNLLSNALFYVRNMTVETDDDAEFRVKAVDFCDKLLLNIANSSAAIDVSGKFKDVYTFSPLFPFNNQELMKEKNLNGYFLSKLSRGRHHLPFGSRDIRYTFKKYVADIDLPLIKPEDFTPETYKSYIVQNANKMDVMILTFPSDPGALYARIYRQNRKDGKIIITTDTNRQLIKVNFGMQHPELIQPLFRIADVVTAPAHNLRDIQNRNKENKFPTFTLRHSFANATGEDLSVSASEKENIILTVGNLELEYKNVVSLIRAFSICADLIPDWKLVLAGKLSEEYRRQIITAFSDIKNRIIFTGELEKAELYTQYKAAKIFCMPTFCDDTPLVCSEAMAMGCYQVLSDSMDGAEDLTRGGEYGVVYEQEKYIVHPKPFRYEYPDDYKGEAEQNLASALVEAAHKLDYNFFKEFIPKSKELQRTEFDYSINARIMALLLFLK
jgi:glycosyltransferase involved in cell wall biosynthesis